MSIHASIRSLVQPNRTYMDLYNPFKECSRLLRCLFSPLETLNPKPTLIDSSKVRIATQRP